MSIIVIFHIIDIICIIHFMLLIDIIAFESRLLDLFRTVFPYRNKLNRHIMETEKVHSIKHCHVDVTNYANPMNCCTDGPEGGHKTWVHEQGLRTNQGSSSAKTLMEHSLNKEASQLLCDAVRCRVEDGDATAEDWTDSNGKTLAADRFWNSGIETMIAGDEEGQCLGIQLNIWERAKVIFSCYALFKLCALYLLYTLSSLFSIARQVRRHIVHTLVGGGGQHGGFDALDYRKIRQGNAGKLGTYEILSVLPDKFARFLFEFHAHRFESLDLPFIPADRSDFDVHGALLDDKVHEYVIL